MHENEMGTLIVDSAVHLHQDPGPGLLETVCEVTLSAELRQRGLSVERPVAVAMEYARLRLDEGFRVDLIVEGKVIGVLPSVENVHPAHQKQVPTYLRLTGWKPGYLLNFGDALMKDGIKGWHHTNCVWRVVSFSVARCLRETPGGANHRMQGSVGGPRVLKSMSTPATP